MMKLREKIKRLLASTLALTTVITALPSMPIKAGIDITVPSSLTVDTSKVAFNVVVEGFVYDEETMTDITKCHTAGYFTTTFNFKPEDGATTKNIDISSIYDSVLSYCNKTDFNDIVRGTASISSSDSRVSATLTDDDTKLVVDIQPDDIPFSPKDNIISVKLPFYFDSDLAEYEFDFNGTYNRGFAEGIEFTYWGEGGGSWTIPSIDNIHNPNKKPILVVTDYDYSATGLFPTAEVVWLASTSIPNKTGSSEWYPLGSESAYNSFQGYDEYTKTFDLSGITYDTDNYEDYVLEGVTERSVGNPNATASFDPDNASYVDVIATKTVNGTSYPTSLTLKVKSGNYVAADPSLEDSYYSDCFGMNAYDVFVVKYKGIKTPTSYTDIVDYYNVFNNDIVNATFVGTVKTINKSGVATTVGTIPSTDIEGWIYVDTTDEMVVDDTVHSHKKVYRYFIQTESKTFSYNLKYKVVWADGTPAEGITVNSSYLTDDTGFISKVDTYSIELDDIVTNASNDKYAKSVTLNPNSTSDIINVECDSLSHTLKYNWSGVVSVNEALGVYPRLDETDNPSNFEFNIMNNDASDTAVDVSKTDNYNFVCTIKLNRNKPTSTDYNIPIRIHYGVKDDADNFTDVAVDSFTVPLHYYEGEDPVDLIGFSVRNIEDSTIEAIKTDLGVENFEFTSASIDPMPIAFIAATYNEIINPTINTEAMQLEDGYVKTSYLTDNYDYYFGRLQDTGIDIHVGYKAIYGGKAVIHFVDTNGNKIQSDVTLTATNNNYASVRYLVDGDTVAGYSPTGKVTASTSKGVSYENTGYNELSSNNWKIYDLGSSGIASAYGFREFWETGWTSNESSKSLVVAAKSPSACEDLEVTVEFTKAATVNFYRVDDYDYGNATYLGTVTDLKPSKKMYISTDRDSTERLDVDTSDLDTYYIDYYYIDNSYTQRYDGYTKTMGTSKSGLTSGRTTFTDGDDFYLCFSHKYTIKVYDDLYDNTGMLERHILRTTDTYYYGDSYSYNKVNKSGYEFKGTSPISGVVTKDQDIIFSYYAPSVEVDVIDKYLNTAGSTQRKKLRLSDTMAVGTTYSYNALNPTGYSLVGASTQSGTADTDTTLTFTYQQAPEYRTITVHDAYYESDGTTLIKTEDRDVETVLKGSTYNVDAKTVAGYEVFGNTNYSGTANSNVEVTFTYKKIPSYTVTVIDEYQSSEGVVTSSVTRSTDTYVRDSVYTYNALSPIGYTLQTVTPQTGTVTGNLTVKFVYKANAFTIKVIDEYLDANGVVESSTIRLTDTKDYGYNYSYSALTVPAGSQLMTDATQSGVLTNNVEIKFIYKKLKTFTITVEDKYIKTDGTVDHVDTRLTDTVLENVAYSYNALDPVPTDYVLTSEATYSGVATQDATITFTYTDNTARFVTVKGYITYADGTPIANKVIEIHSSPRTTTTDANGYYEIDNVEVGDHTFTIFEDAAKTVKIATADIVVSTPDNDTVTVTFKDTDTEVNTDTSQSNVLKIDAILPLYNLKVVDEYYTDGSLEKSETRVDTTLKKGDIYSYSALSPDGYTLEGSVTYAGTITENTVLTFKYVKTATPPVTPTSYTLTVKDEYYIDGALNKSAVRETKSVTLGESYSYNALSPVGYSVEGSTSYSGTITGDLTLVFKYVKTTTPIINTYKVTVIDKYYRNDDSLESVNTRCVDTYTEGSSYSYSALSPANYTVTSAKSFSGVVNSDITVTFTYKKDKEPEKPTYVTIKVIDNYFDSSSVLQDSVLRVETIVTTGTSYDYQALNPSGYTVSGQTRYTGKATSNVTINFNYVQKEDEPTKYTITVIDEFYDAEGSLESADTRLVDAVDAGYIYSYNAINKLCYKVTSVSNYTGIANSDLVLTFTYQKEAKKLKDYTITVIDRYITDTPVPAKYTVTEQHTTNDMYYETKINTVTNHESVVTVTRVIRCSDTYKEGAEYYYEALNPAGYTVVGNKAYKGVVNSDMTLEFVYSKGFDSPEDIPEDIEIPDPVNKDEFPEPKTGDSSLPWLPAIPVLAGVVLVIYKRKRR